MTELGTFAWRLQEIERRLKELETSEVDQREVDRLWIELGEARREMSDLRKSLIVSAISFASGSLMVAVTIWQVLG